ncbi:prolipoprotein diacylglyceryl transferase [Propionimicrobium sp. PCR01-08-3]|uniref:prolipoprotein diacylglyceryl transferase n=1 Tax=Propionimicrobium sp. PCR01-08-3 TaxID=3052086 RepID=UPI00255C6345|nr:prolipoprotein diacylglyceryl transferase [Propionimicrobium sp. PCR01-08-3]WIY83861.1 prolipoprotein diacylglyceryl transferase [Propionimicrobium sp. PCR01-08-3]
MTPLQIPAPPSSGISLGGFTLHYYALCVLAGIIVAVLMGRTRFVRRGGSPDRFDSAAFIIVITGIIGARAYHVITDHQLYFGPGRDPWQALNIRAGGLGIWGGVMVGALASWLICRRHKLDFGSFADTLAPGLFFAQAIGRLGNWFNQELFGRPTDLPWGLYVDSAHRPDGYREFETFHPTFAYEMITNTIGGILLLWAERRFKLGRGKLFSCYIIWYTLCRFFIEMVRIDPANEIGGWRINNYVSLICFVGAVILLIWQLRKRPGVMWWPFGFPDGGAGLSPARSRVPSDDTSPVELTDSDASDMAGPETHPDDR